MVGRLEEGKGKESRLEANKITEMTNDCGRLGEHLGEDEALKDKEKRKEDPKVSPG